MFWVVDAEGNGSRPCIIFHVQKQGNHRTLRAIFVDVFSGVLAEQKLGGEPGCFSLSSRSRAIQAGNQFESHFGYFASG